MKEDKKEPSDFEKAIEESIERNKSSKDILPEEERLNPSDDTVAALENLSIDDLVELNGKYHKALEASEREAGNYKEMYENLKYVRACETEERVQYLEQKDKEIHKLKEENERLRNLALGRLEKIGDYSKENTSLKEEIQRLKEREEKMNNTEMEMPTPCQKCGEIFDLNDGAASEKWFPNTIICESCVNIEQEEIEQDEIFEDENINLCNALFTFKETPERINSQNIKLIQEIFQRLKP